MVRIDDRLLVQRVDQQMVLINEQSGDEVVFPVEDTERVVRAMAYLATGNLEGAKAIRLPSSNTEPNS